MLRCKYGGKYFSHTILYEKLLKLFREIITSSISLQYLYLDACLFLYCFLKFLKLKEDISFFPKKIEPKILEEVVSQGYEIIQVIF